MMRRRMISAAVGFAAVLSVAAVGRAQECNDSDQCTTNDMCSEGHCSGSPISGGDCDDSDPCTTNDTCSDGVCAGSPISGGSCDDFNDCTVNERCENGFCAGDPLAVGTECQGGCGTCQLPFGIPIPGFPPLCAPKVDAGSLECTPVEDDLAGCFGGRCQEFSAGEFAFVYCLPAPKQCPDTDGNPCTDACNFATGECERIEKPCGFQGCGRCDPATGECVSANEGLECNDFNDCTAESRCQDGRCLEGVPTPGEETPSPTATPDVTPTAEAGGPDGSECTSDGECDSGFCVDDVCCAVPTCPEGQVCMPGSGDCGIPEPEATPTPLVDLVCPGDCNGDKSVKVNELVTGVNIGLEIFPWQACAAANVDENESVTINELVLAVNAGLKGCPNA